MALVLPADKSVVKEKTVTNSFFESKLHPNDLKITLLARSRSAGWTLTTRRPSTVSPSIGLFYEASDALIFLFEVMRWKIRKDMEKQDASYQNVLMKTQGLFRKNSTSLHWPDSFAIDSYGYLWFTTNKLNLFFTNNMDFAGGDANFRIWKVFIGEESYLGNFSNAAAFLSLSLPLVFISYVL